MRILLVQTSFLGDVVLSTPVIAEIHKRHPEAELWVMTTPTAAPLLQEDPLVKEVIPFDKRGTHSGLKGMLRMTSELRALNFDLTYCLHRSIRTAILLALSKIPLRIGFRESRGFFLFHKTVNRQKDRHEVLRNLSLLQVETTGQTPEPAYPLRLYCSHSPSDSVLLANKTFLDGDYLVLVPGSVWKTKQWSGQQYHQLCRYALARGLKVCILGTSEEKEVCDQVAEGLGALNLAGQTDLRSFLAVIRDASLVVCNDSFALHVAAAFKVPTVAVFCATSPAFGFTPWQENARVVEKQGLWCKPCRRHGSQSCPTGTESCMKDLSWREVWFHCELLIKGSPV